MEIHRKTPTEPESGIPVVPGNATPDEPALGSESARGMALVQPDDIPSRYLPYPSGTSIFYRPYTFGEIETFNDSALSESERLRFVLAGILCKGIEPGALTLADWLYLGMLRKLSVFGTNKFTVVVPANEEEGRLAHSEIIDMNRISVHDLDVPALPACITINGKDTHFNPLTVGAFAELMVKLREDATRAGDDVEVRSPTESEILAYQCINMPTEDALKLIQGATKHELIDLQDLDRLFQHRVNPLTITWMQDEKEYTETIAIDDPIALVWPFRGPEESSRSTLRFGLS